MLLEISISHRKQPKNINLRIRNSVKDGTVRQQWDRSKTPAENLEAAGLVSDVNKFINDSNGLNSDSSNSAFVGFMSVAELDGTCSLDTNRKRRLMSEGEQQYASRCMEVHGEDFKSMSRDIETNYKQLTESQLRKLCRKLMSLNESQKLVSSS